MGCYNIAKYVVKVFIFAKYKMQIHNRLLCNTIRKYLVMIAFQTQGKILIMYLNTIYKACILKYSPSLQKMASKKL